MEREIVLGREGQVKKRTVERKAEGQRSNQEKRFCSVKDLGSSIASNV
jgi:hypothetical protein